MATNNATNTSNPVSASQGGTAQSTYAKGDILYASAANTLSKLPVGTDGQVLTLATGVPTWAAATGGVTSVSGTTNRITSTGGSTPVIDISASYVGQSSITTLGTIGTGVWNGSTITEGYGGTNQTTYTKGDTLYASAANTLSKLPLGSPGYPIASIGGVPTYAGIRNCLYYYDDFLYNQFSILGILNQDATGGGSGITNVIGTLTNPGIIKISAGTTGACQIQTARNPCGILLGNGVFTFDVLVNIPTLSNGTNRFTVFLGLTDTYNLIDGTNEVTFIYSDNINSGNWTARTTKASSATTADTTVTVVANTWYHLQFVVNAAASSVDFTVNGGSKQTINTNIPLNSTALKFTMGIKETVGTAVVSMYLDCYSICYEFTTPRW